MERFIARDSSSFSVTIAGIYLESLGFLEYGTMVNHFNPQYGPSPPPLSLFLFVVPFEIPLLCCSLIVLLLVGGDRISLQVEELQINPIAVYLCNIASIRLMV